MQYTKLLQSSWTIAVKKIFCLPDLQNLCHFHHLNHHLASLHYTVTVLLTLLNLFTMGIFWAAMTEGQKGPSLYLKSVTHVPLWWNAVQLYLN